MTDREQTFGESRWAEHAWLIRELGFRYWLREIVRCWLCRRFGHSWGPEQVQYEEHYLYARWHECERCERYEELPL